MILYNITYNVDKTVETEWLEFMKNQHTPVFLKTGYFTEQKLLRLLNEEYSEGTTYCFQFFTESLEELRDFQETYEASIENNLEAKFKGKYVFFKTWLEEL